MPVAAPARVTVADVVKGDRVALPGWPKVKDVQQRAIGGRIRLVLEGGRPFPAMSPSAGILVRHAEAPAPPAPQFAEPTNPQPVAVAEFKRAMTPGSRWLVTNHIVQSGACAGMTERTILGANTVELKLSIPGSDEASHMRWPKRGMVKRADGGGIFLVYSERTDDDPALFLTVRPA